MSQQQTVSTYTARVAFAQKVHKQAEGPEDNQDAFEAEPNSSRFAVADGTTTSFLSAPWARLLVQHFCRDNNTDLAGLQAPANWENWLTPVRAQWQSEVTASLEYARGSSAILLQNRYAEQQPAAATFVGVQFDYASQRWQALAIGDSCLLHVRAHRLLQSIPYTRADQFSNITAAIASTPQSSPQMPQLYAGEFQPGDIFLLLTDAIARWTIAQHESDETVWRAALKQLQSLRYRDDLRTLVDAQRASGALVNDDVTVVVLKIDAASMSSPIDYFSAPKVEVAARPSVPVSVNPVHSSSRPRTNQLLPQKQRRRVAATICNPPPHARRVLRSGPCRSAKPTQCCCARARGRSRCAHRFLPADSVNRSSAEGYKSGARPSAEIRLAMGAESSHWGHDRVPGDDDAQSVLRFYDKQ